MRSVFLSIFLSCFFLSAIAQEPVPASQPMRAAPLTLDQLESIALQNNPEVRMAVQKVATASARVSSAGSLDDPMAMYRNWGTPLSQPWNWNQAQSMFSIQQTFPGKGKRALRSQIAGADVDISKTEVEAVRRDVLSRVRKAYFDLLRNRDESRILTEQAQLTQQGIEAARIKYSVGRGPQQDVLKAQIASTKLAEARINIEQDGEMARATLNTLLGRDPEASLEVAGDYRAPEVLPAVLDLQKIAIENRPELAAFRQAIAQSADKERLAKLGYKPDITVGGGYMLMPSGSMSRNAYMAEVTVNLPWLNKRKHEAEIAEAKAMGEQQKAELDAQRAMVFMQLQDALIRARAAYKQFVLYRDTLRPQAEATLRAASAAYQNDRTDFLNLLDSQNLTLDVQSSYYRALSDYEARLADLERAIGAPLPRPNGAPVAQFNQEASK